MPKKTPEDEIRSKRLEIRLAPKEYEVLEEAAYMEGMTIYPWARQMLIKWARRVIRRG